MLARFILSFAVVVSDAARLDSIQESLKVEDEVRSGAQVVMEKLAFDAVRQNTRALVLAEVRAVHKAPSPFRELKTKEEAQAAFKQLDGNGDGQMTKAELQQACEADAACKEKMLPQIDMVFRMMDADGTGTISEAEFVAFAVPPADPADIDEAAMAFKMMDEDGSGCISPENLGKMLTMGAPPGQMSADEATMMAAMIVMMFDQDQSGCLNLEEWRLFMDSAKESLMQDSHTTKTTADSKAAATRRVALLHMKQKFNAVARRSNAEPTPEEIFKMIDVDGTGCIGPAEVGAMMMMGADGEMTAEDAAMVGMLMVAMGDQDGNNCLDLEEWKAFLVEMENQQ